MPRTRRVMPFLQRRQATWYLRFRLPVRLQALAGRSELRLSLGTRELSVARQRAEQVLPDVYCLKQLARNMSALEPGHVQRALDLALSRLAEELHRTREPWMRGRQQSIHNLEMGSGKSLPSTGDSKFVTPGRLLELQLTNLRGAIERGEYGRGADRARQLLQETGAPVDEESSHFRRLAVELLKVDAMFLEAQKARASGDFRTEEELIAYYMRSTARREPRAVLVTAAPAVIVAPSGARLSEAWQEYAREKMAAMPRPQWSEKTAAFQESTFREFLEIVSDLSLGEVSREIIIRYAETLRKLPKNRRKIHGDRPIKDLLVVNVAEKDRASERTLSEKLIRIKAFLDWCRVTKGQPATDPTERISFQAESQSYAPFTQTDLVALFNSEDHQRSQHAKAWRFWIPLIALYTGARQAEIAQLTVTDIGVEDGVPFISITNYGEGKRVKTQAGIRKVPISSKLIGLGFLDYVEALRTSGTDSVFPDLRRKRGDSSSDSSAVSRWFNAQYLEACGVERRDSAGKRKVFHSFRHTAISKALSAGHGLLAHCQQVFGHEKSILGETATYMGSFPVAVLMPVIEALDYGLDHSSYRDSWRRYVGAIRK
jgi:integrase